MRCKRLTISFFAAALAVFFAAASVQAGKKPPAPGTFVPQVTNPYFPLPPGTTFNYTGQKDGVPNTNATEVTCGTKTIQNVTTTVVHDRAYDENGALVEDTLDWYAQDVDGNVWYFGEDTKELDPVTGQTISTEGSWEAGMNGALPGIIMEANPQEGDHYYQEFARGVAEDQARVTDADASACISYPQPNSCFDDLLLTQETTRLSPGGSSSPGTTPGPAAGCSSRTPRWRCTDTGRSP